MARRMRSPAVWLAGVAAASLVALPVFGQESLLPPGFDQPKGAPTPAPRGTPSPAPRATPTPRSTPAPAPRGGQTGAATPAPAAPAAPPASTAAPPPVAPAVNDALAPIEDDGVVEGDEDASAETTPPPPPRYDLPPGSRRLLTKVGLFTPESGGLPPGAYGVRGLYVTRLMDATRSPLVSRWGSILLRRALLSGVDTPSNINGADFVAARAWLLLRQGEAQGARMLVQSVDTDKASPRLRAVALQVALATADPAMACPYAPAMAGQGDDSWDLVQAMCSAMVGESGTANAVLERIRRRGRLAAIDIKLAEKVIGAGVNSRRRAIVRWDGVDQLTPWRLGLAAATGVDVPDQLWQSATPAMRYWALQMPMIPLEKRLPFAAASAEKGVLSARGYVDFISWASDTEELDSVEGFAGGLRLAFVAANLSDRVRAIGDLTQTTDFSGGYAGRVLGARAAARIGPADVDDAETYTLLAAMFAGGLDNNALAWVPRVRVGSQSWGLLAVGSPRALAAADSGDIGRFAGDDSSTDQRRTRMLAAALIGLGRVAPGDADGIARDYALALGTDTAWVRNIRIAADRGEAGTVALLAAAGLQGRDWSKVPPYHLYQITRALARVGLEADARMIAAEAVTRG